jgi:hypothetical protein
MPGFLSIIDFGVGAMPTTSKAIPAGRFAKRCYLLQGKLHFLCVNY